MQSPILATLVWVLHMAFVLWVVVVPFTNNEPMLVLHLIVMPFLWFHWLLNDDTCALTLLERQLRGVPSQESFFHNIVSPVYKIKDEQVRSLSWVLSVALWLLTLSKVMRRPGMVKDVFMGRRSSTA